MTVVLARTDFRIVHASIQANHVHLVVEADSKLGLARGMQGFQISAAKRLNQIDTDRRGSVRRGPVFVDPYHAEALTSPTRARRALAYVLNNWRRHKEDLASQTTRSWLLDRYSSAILFAGWKEHSRWIVPDDYDPLPVVSPQTWLLREGWKRGGGSISVYERTGPRSDA